MEATMLDINLLPQELRKKKAARFALTGIDVGRLSKQALTVSMLAATALLAAIQAFILLSEAVSGSQNKALEKRHKDLAPRKEIVDGLKGRMESLERKTAAIDELMVGQISWAKKLEALSDSVVPGLWLTELSLDEKAAEVRGKGPEAAKGPSMLLSISGRAWSERENATASIVKFIDSLKRNRNFYDDFSRIELSGPIEETRIADQDVMSFKITCVFKGGKI